MQNGNTEREEDGGTSAEREEDGGASAEREETAAGSRETSPDRCHDDETSSEDKGYDRSSRRDEEHKSRRSDYSQETHNNVDHTKRDDVERNVDVNATSASQQRPTCRTISVGGQDSNAVNSPPQSPGDLAVSQSTSKLDLIKAWSVNKIVCTRQLLSERLGNASRTVDVDVQLQIDITREAQQKLEELLMQARTLTESFALVVQNQQALNGTFRELAQKMPELNSQFECNADTQKVMHKRGQILLNDLNFFTSNVATLCGKTIEDTLSTIKQYESARLEYDAHRNSIETEGKNTVKSEEALKQFNVHKEKYERLRQDVLVKIKLLNDNKLKVMHKQLFLFHCAVTAYFTDNHSAMVSSQQRFKAIRVQPIGAAVESDEL